jgi:transcriptional regulator with XRE-family HTH domain
MNADALTGSRIRERRLIAGLRQAELARRVGISASYLNLIEHNRRRIGGKLLLGIARALQVEPGLLTEGAEAALIASLREAEADVGTEGVELDRIEDFAGRFPGWARLLAATHLRVTRLEQTVDALGDRLTHDPALAAAVHEVLSTAASIRSTAAILAETDRLEPEWLDRFHSNINEDSARLAESSRALAGYLEDGGPAEGDAAQRLPQEEVDAYLAQHDYRFDAIEAGTGDPAEIARDADVSPAARPILDIVLRGYAADARRLPLADLAVESERQQTLDPVALAQATSTPVAVVLRRLASLPDRELGYVMADRSGSLLLRKAVPGFALPRFGASCPLWPVFGAFSQPGTVLRRSVVQLGRREAGFDCIAVTEEIGGAGYNMPPLLRSGMLILPARSPDPAPQKVGATCRLCPRGNCPARREPSVLQTGL